MVRHKAEILEAILVLEAWRDHVRWILQNSQSPWQSWSPACRRNWIRAVSEVLEDEGIPKELIEDIVFGSNPKVDHGPAQPTVS